MVGVIGLDGDEPKRDPPEAEPDVDLEPDLVLGIMTEGLGLPYVFLRPFGILYDKRRTGDGGKERENNEDRGLLSV